MTGARDRGALAGFRIEEVGTVSRLRAVEAEWDDLWSRAPLATPFTSPAWLLPWCDHLLGGRPWALLAWRGARLAAVLPAFVYRRDGRSILGLLGGGVSDYQDVVADDVAAVGAVLEHLARCDGPFDTVELEALPPSSLMLATACPPALSSTIARQEVCPVLPLPCCPEDLARRASDGLLADVRYQRRRLSREGAWELVPVRRDTLDAFLSDLFRLHRARWSARGEAGVLDGEPLRDFHRDAARALLARGLLRSHALVVRGATVGVFHGFASHGRSYAYLPAMDPGAARYSPGSLLFAHALERAIADGCGELDFLRGAEAYKYRWGAEDRFSSRLTIDVTGDDATSPARRGASAGARGEAAQATAAR